MILGIMYRDEVVPTRIWDEFRREMLRHGDFSFGRCAPNTDLAAAVRDRRPTAILIHCTLPSNLSVLADFDLPIVNTSGMLENPTAPTVTLANAATGHLAARHLIERGCRNLATFGTLRANFTKQRFQGFCDEANRLGMPVTPFEIEHQSAKKWLSQPDSQLRKWLLSLPQGTGVFVTDDKVGANFINFCRLMGREPGLELPVLSGHYQNVPSKPEISAIQQPEARWGQEAARRLQRIIEGTDGPAEQPTLLPPIRVIERESTLGYFPGDPSLAKAVNFIRDAVGSSINVEDVARAAALSRRALERRFSTGLGRPVLQEIHRSQLEKAKQLLVETDLTIYAVARECGLTNDNALRRLFQKWEDQTPAEFRSLHRVQV